MAQVILTNAFYPPYHNHSLTDLDVVLAKVNHRSCMWKLEMDAWRLF
jgi:hypothetical protein